MSICSYTLFKFAVNTIVERQNRERDLDLVHPPHIAYI